MLRRQFLKYALVVGASITGVGARSLVASASESLYFDDEGWDFRNHIVNEGRPGRDWTTSQHSNTLIAAMAEGKVRMVRENYRKSEVYIEIQHFGGKETAYFHLTNNFVKEGDYVGRNSIIGTGGKSSTGHPHIHIEYGMPKPIFDLLDSKEYEYPEEVGQKLKQIRLDPDAQGEGGYGLELWTGQRDLFSSYAIKNIEIMHYIDSLLPRAKPEFIRKLQNKINKPPKDINYPLPNPDAIKVLGFHGALTKYFKGEGARWVGKKYTKQERQKLTEYIKEFANLRQPLTLPFVNPNLYNTPCIYHKGSTATTLEDFTKQYMAILQLIKKKT